MASKNVLVTGSSRGIGKAVALEFAKNGYNIIINCRNSIDALQKTKMEIESYGVTCLAIPGNVGDYTFARELMDTIHGSLGKLDVLINNAGISYVGLLQDLKPEEWQNILQTNLSSVFYMSSLVIPDMLSIGQGKIINISSVWGVVGASCEAAYSATKGGINGLTMALGKELAPSNIQVNAIACGAIDTEMNGFLSEEDKESLIEEIPASRMGKAEEVARLAYDLATGHDYMTAQVIKFDGGWI